MFNQRFKTMKTKKYRYTHIDGEQEIITSRLTMEELTMIMYAVSCTFDDVAYNEDNEKNDEHEDKQRLRKMMYRVMTKLKLKGVTGKHNDKFFEEYLPE